MNVNLDKDLLSLVVDKYEELDSRIKYTDYDQFVIAQFIDRLNFLLDERLIRGSINSVMLNYSEVEMVYDILYAYKKRIK